MGVLMLRHDNRAFVATFWKEVLRVCFEVRNERGSLVTHGEAPDIAAALVLIPDLAAMEVES